MLIKNYDIHPLQAEAIADSLFNIRSFDNIRSKEYFNGLLIANQYESVFNNEVAATLLDPSISAYQRNIENIKEEFYNLRETYTIEAENIKSVSTSEQKSIEELKDNLEDQFYILLHNYTQKGDDLIKATQSKINDFELTFLEKLRLEGPAKYWETTAKEYEKKGFKWMIAALIFGGVFAVVFGLLLWNLPNTDFKINFKSLKFTVLLTVIISVGIFLINLFVKLSLSAYHLSRDANERLQLTYVYLALIKDNAIESEERNIVLKSIFSRSDTGLLKGDSSPTIPDSGIASILKMINTKP